MRKYFITGLLVLVPLAITLWVLNLIIGLLDRPNTRLLRAVGWVSLALFTVYLLNTYVMYLHGD